MRSRGGRDIRERLARRRLGRTTYDVDRLVERRGPRTVEPDIEVALRTVELDDDAAAGRQVEPVEVVRVRCLAQLAGGRPRHGDRGRVGRHVVQPLEVEEAAPHQHVAKDLTVAPPLTAWSATRSARDASWKLTARARLKFAWITARSVSTEVRALPLISQSALAHASPAQWTSSLQGKRATSARVSAVSRAGRAVLVGRVWLYQAPPARSCRTSRERDRPARSRSCPSPATRSARSDRPRSRRS